MWLIQNKIWKEEKYDLLFKYMDKYKIPYKKVNIIPFEHKFTEDIDIPSIDMFFGSVRMTDIMRKGGGKVYYDNENFNYKTWGLKFENFCLNLWDQTTIISIDNLKLPLKHDVFIRPILDDKSFTGMILRAGDTTKAIQFATGKVIGDIEVAYSPIKQIYSEYRFVVVDGKIITGSMYKWGSRVIYKQYAINSYIGVFAQQLVDIWTPSELCIIDIADTPEGLCLIEFGCIHNFGFYDIDLSKMIQTIYLRT